MKILIRNLWLAAALALTGCAGISQYPDDPGADSDIVAGYQQYFGSNWVVDYETVPDDRRAAVRDTIVINRMLAYDAAYNAFKRKLLTEGNSLNTGADLIVLALSGLGATTGSAATKAGLAAASAGIVGAKTAISSDLFYQRTLPAIIAQMDANRATVKTAILLGLGRSDADYPLARALVDLQQLNDAGSMIGAVSSITQDAAAQKGAAERVLTFSRTAAFKATLQTRQSLVAAIGNLSNAQVLQLLQMADSLLATDQAASAAFNRFPRAALTSNPTLARTALQAAMAEADGDSAALQKWTDAIRSLK